MVEKLTDTYAGYAENCSKLFIGNEGTKDEIKLARIHVLQSIVHFLYMGEQSLWLDFVDIISIEKGPNLY